MFSTKTLLLKHYYRHQGKDSMDIWGFSGYSEFIVTPSVRKGDVRDSVAGTEVQQAASCAFKAICSGGRHYLQDREMHI